MIPSSSTTVDHLLGAVVKNVQSFQDTLPGDDSIKEKLEPENIKVTLQIQENYSIMMESVLAKALKATFAGGSRAKPEAHASAEKAGGSGAVRI